MDNDKLTQLQEWYQLLKDNTITQKEFDKKKAELLNEGPVISATTVFEQAHEILKKYGSITNKYFVRFRWWVVSIVILAVLSIPGYRIFSYYSTRHDARVLAREYCACVDLSLEEYAKLLKRLNNDFVSKNFTSQANAIYELDQIKLDNQKNLEIRLHPIDSAYQLKLEKLMLKNERLGNLFKETYNVIISGHKNSLDEINTLTESIQYKIANVSKMQPFEPTIVFSHPAEIATSSGVSFKVETGDYFIGTLDEYGNPENGKLYYKSGQIKHAILPQRNH